MQGPIDYARGRIDNWRAHPFQNIASTLFGGFVPGGGLAANALFNRYNDSRFNSSTNQANSLINDQLGIDTNQAMNRPLSGPLGQFDDQGTYGNGGAPTSGGRAEQDRQLGQALQGGGGGQSFGGSMGGAGYAPPGGWNQVSMSGWNPNQASGSQAFGLLDFLGPNMNKPFDIPTTPSSGGHMSPEARREGSNVGPGIGNYGVSNFMVGGSPVIFGAGDPNGRYRNRGSQYGG